MKLFVGASLVSLLALAGCTPASEEEQAAEPDEEVITEEEVTEEVGEAYEAMKGYSYDQKEALEEWAQSRLDELNQQMELLDRRMDGVSDEVRQQYREKMTDLEEERDTVRQRLEELQASSAEAWSDVKSGFLGALEQLERGLDKAEEDFREAEAKSL